MGLKRIDGREQNFPDAEPELEGLAPEDQIMVKRVLRELRKTPAKEEKLMEAKRIDPTVEELAKALRLCAADEPAARYPCESCYLYPYRNADGETSAGQFCHMTLALDAGAKLRRLEAENAALRERFAGAGPGWISVKDRLPDRFCPVIVSRNGKVEQGMLDLNGWWKVYGTRTKSVTNWMPLPEPPKEVR